MTDKQFTQHEKLMVESIETTKGVQQLLQRLIDIANTNLNEVGQSKQLLEQILRAVEK